MTDNILIPVSLLFRKDRKAYCALKRILGFYPRHLHYYKQALMHKSMHQRTADGQRVNNERLEFLGDAILGAVVGDIVYRHFKGKREGFLTNTRSKLVQRDTLNRVAVEIGLDKLIQYSISSSSHNSYMCGNAFEALIGAIYLDRGYNCCMQFINERILHRLLDIDKVANKEMNYKSKLIEWCQKKKVRFEFKIVGQHRERSESYSPVFDSQVLLNGIVCGEGSGYSKKESHQAAAKIAYKRIRGNKQLAEQVFAAKEVHKEPVVQSAVAEELPVAVEASGTSVVESVADTNYFSEAAIISIPQLESTTQVETSLEEEIYTKEY
ncbi:MAG: ribonuclease III [Bacteroidaceae bacterium]|nr:ribonuclease III [Bacteroidaceae bacterium]